MADSEYTILVSAIGDLTKAIKQSDTLGATINKVNKSSKEGAKNAKEHTDALNSGAAGANNATRSFSRLLETTNGSSGVVKAYATLATNAFAVSAAFTALRSAAQVEQLMKGLEAQGARTGHTLSITADSIQKIAKNSISAADAMRATAQASAAGISTKDIERLTKVATNSSIALGRNVPDSINRLVLAVAKAEPELVDELGLTVKMTEAQATYARQIHKTVASLSQYEKQQALLNAWVTQGELKFSGMSDAVDTNPYDKLAASFTNLIQNVLTFVNNTGIVSFVQLLSNDMYALGTGVLLFASTIGKALLPGLTEAAKAAHTLSDARLVDLEIQKKQLAVTKEELAVSKEKNTKALKSLTLGKGMSTPTYDKWLEALKTGAQNEQMQKGAFKSLEDAIKRDQKNIIKAGPDTDKASIYLDRKKAREDVLTNAKAGAATEIALTDSIAEAEKKGAIISLQASKTKLEGLAQEARATAIEALQNGKLQESIIALQVSTSEYADSIRAGIILKAEERGATDAQAAANTLLAETIITAKTELFASITTIKALGVAFLEWLPILALIPVAIDLITGAIDYFTPKSIKIISEAYKEFNTVLESTAKKLAQATEIQNQTASASDKAAALLTNQTATVYELADSYLALRKAAKEARDAESKKSTEGTSLKPDIIRQEISKYKVSNGFAAEAKISDSSKAIEFLSSNIEDSTGVFGGYDKEVVAAAASLDNLEKQYPGLIKHFYESNKGLKTSAERLDAIDKLNLLASTSNHTLDVSQKDLTKSTQDLNTGYTDFIRSISTTTPYDTILTKYKSFSNASKSLSNTIQDMKTNNFDTKSLEDNRSALLSGLKGDARNIFTPKLQMDLSSFDETSQKVDALKATMASLEGQGVSKNSNKYKSVDAEHTKQLGIMNKLSAGNTDEINKQVAAYEKRLEQAKASSIEGQADLAIAQARLSVIQRQGIITASDVDKQTKAQNNIIAIQQSQLKVQESFIKIDIEKARMTLLELQNNQELLDLLQKQTDEKSKQAVATKLTALEEKKAALEKSGKKVGDTEFDTTVSNIDLLKKTSASEAKTKFSQNKLIIDQTKDSIQNLGMQVQAYDKQIAALGMGMVTSAENTAAKNRITLKNLEEQYQIEKEIADLNRNRQTSEEDILNILSGSKNTLDNELIAIKRNSIAKIDASRKELEFRTRNLNIEITLAKAQGNKSHLVYYTNLLDLAKQKQVATEKDIQSQTTIDIINKVAIKNEEDRLNRQKEIYDLQTKILDATKEETVAQSALEEAISATEDKKRGIADSGKNDLDAQIKAAKLSYDNAIAEASVKKELIALEFLLLKAKKAQTLADTQTSIDTMAEKAKDYTLEAARLRGQAARTPEEQVGTGNDIVVRADKRKSLLNQATDLENKSLALTNQTKVLSDLILQLGKISDEKLDKGSKSAQNVIDLQDKTALEQRKALATEGPRVAGGFYSDLQEAQKRKDTYITKAASAKELGVKGPTALDSGLDEMKVRVDKMKENLAALGPGGELVSALNEGALTITNSFVDAFRVISDSSAKTTDKLVAGFQLVSNTISTLSSINKAAADVKVAAVDREISAEEKRDGKSVQSLAKIRELEKKKDDIQRKAFELNKKMQMAQAVVSTASGIAQALTMGPIVGPIMAGIIGAMGAAQIAVIAGTQYESALPVQQVQSISIGKRSDTVDLAKGPSANAGGEAGFITGSPGYGSNASNYRTVGSAYGGDLMRGYGNRGFVVGEKGPEVITPETPISVTPANDTSNGPPISANINIHALDSSDVQRVLVEHKGNIIQMLREAANSKGKRFMEDVNVNVYTRPNVGRLL